MQKWLTNNFWLKLISLILAVVTWLYISGELAKRQAGFYSRPPVMPKPE
jgi:YbbR domain-containing protein